MIVLQKYKKNVVLTHVSDFTIKTWIQFFDLWCDAFKHAMLTNVCM